MISTKAIAVSGPTPGCVASRCASAYFSTSRSTPWLNQRWLGSTDPATPADRAVVGSPTKPAGTIPGADVRYATTAAAWELYPAGRYWQFLLGIMLSR